jgi:uncharacterized protein (DUF934 family)
MALIRNRKLTQDQWKLLPSLPEGGLPAIPEHGRVIVPLAVWTALREQLLAREEGVGVLLRPEDDPAAIARDLEHVEVIAVHFPSFTDGRGYSTARLLRERYGWRGELRATGDIQRDQLLLLERCGFDTLELREGEDVGVALAGFEDFSEAYQAAVHPPLPLFRRRESGKVA